MKPLTLASDQIKHLMEHGSIMLIEPVEPQPPSGHSYIGIDLLGLHQFNPSEYGPTTHIQSPFGKVGDEFVVRRWGNGDPGTPASMVVNIQTTIHLTHTGITVKRVRDVTEAEAEAMGIIRDYEIFGDGVYACTCSAKDNFKEQWQSQHPDYPWWDNPWAWLPTFEVKK